MLTYNMDVEERSTWLRATPGAAALAQPFYCTEAGNFYGRAHFATARTDKESYILFYTLSGSGLIEQNDQRIELPAGSALLLNCRAPQSYCTAPGQSHWHHYWVHLDGMGVANLAEVLLPQGRLCPVAVSRLEMQPLFEALTNDWEQSTTAAQIERGSSGHGKTRRHNLGGDHRGNGIGAVVRAVGKIEDKSHQNNQGQQHRHIKHFSAPLLQGFPQDYSPRST